jgi:hypothetical protein
VERGLLVFCVTVGTTVNTAVSLMVWPIESVTLMATVKVSGAAPAVTKKNSCVSVTSRNAPCAVDVELEETTVKVATTSPSWRNGV